MTFVHTGFAVLAFAVLPAAFVAQRRVSIAARQQALVYTNLAFLSEALQTRSWPVILVDAAVACGLSLLLLAAAQPRVYATSPDATLAVCLDTSGSMRLRDVAPSRAQAAREAARSLVAGVAPGTRIGIVSFAGTAQYVSAPSTDRSAVLAALAAVPLPNGQTAIGDALRVALTIRPSRIVLITDGANNHGEDPNKVVSTLRVLHVRLDVAGIGGGALSERSLRADAGETGGLFVRARSANELRAWVASLTSQSATIRSPRDCSEAFAFAGLFLLTAAWFAAKRGAFRL